MATHSLTKITLSRNTMSSREIAELTGKTHAHILRDIDKLLETLNPELALGFKSSTYKDATGKDNRMFVMDRDSTYCLIAGYDVNSRMRIIKRWQELESQQSPFKIPQTLSEALQLAADQAKQIEQQTQQIEVMSPKADYYDQIMGSEEVLDGEQAAKVLRMSRRGLYEFLRSYGVLTKSNLPMQLYVDRDYLRVKQTPYKDMLGKVKVSLKVVFTQKGLVYIQEMLRKIMIDPKELAVLDA